MLLKLAGRQASVQVELVGALLCLCCEPNTHTTLRGQKFRHSIGRLTGLVIWAPTSSSSRSEVQLFLHRPRSSASKLQSNLAGKRIGNRMGNSMIENTMNVNLLRLRAPFLFNSNFYWPLLAQGNAAHYRSWFVCVRPWPRRRLESKRQGRLFATNRTKASHSCA